VSLGRRLAENPLLTAHDVRPSLPELEVVSVFNAAAAKVGDEIILLLRVAERPRTDVKPGPNALTLDLDQPHPILHPLPARYRDQELIGMCFLDTHQTPPKVVVAYIPRDLPGLDLRDPRSIRYRNSTGYLKSVNDGYIDFLAQISHLRVARSRDGVHFTVDDEPAIAPHTDLEEYGVEDPRATLIDGVWYITYVSVSRWGITTSLATTTDFKTFEREGVIFLPDHKDVVLFPGKVGGDYVALTRPMPQSFSRIIGIWIAFSNDLTDWGRHEPLALRRCPSSPTTAGWSCITESIGTRRMRWARCSSTRTIRARCSRARPRRSSRPPSRSSAPGSSTTRSSRAATSIWVAERSACITARLTR
jgi:predicted GH43/DUF377 family glycosyl hydrolase